MRSLKSSATTMSLSQNQLSHSQLEELKVGLWDRCGLSHHVCVFGRQRLQRAECTA